MDVKRRLQNASKNLDYNLVLRDKKDEPLKDHIKIFDVADISTRDCRLEMVAVPNHDRSIMTNIHQTGVSSSLAQNTSSNLEDHTRDVIIGADNSSTELNGVYRDGNEEEQSSQDLAHSVHDERTLQDRARDEFVAVATEGCSMLGSGRPHYDLRSKKQTPEPEPHQGSLGQGHLDVELRL